MLFFQIPDSAGYLREDGATPDSAAHLVRAFAARPAMPETPPSPWLVAAPGALLKIIHLDTQDGREKLAGLLHDAPIYRITLELLIDRLLLAARSDDARTKGVRAAFAPEEPPEPVGDAIGEKYAFAGLLHFPIIASRTDVQLIDLYLRLFGPACPEHLTPADHLAAIMDRHPARLTEAHDGILWRGEGWVRLDRMIYDAERLDHDPGVTFESYVTRGRAGAEALAVNDREALLAAWIAAERVQKELCRDIDAALRLPDIRRLPRWVRADVFRVLEREAMKQVFAESLLKLMGDWPALRRARTLAEPIDANAKGEVAPLIQQILNQTLSADARYSGAAEAFSLQAERRMTDARSLLSAK